MTIVYILLGTLRCLLLPLEPVHQEHFTFTTIRMPERVVTSHVPSYYSLLISCIIPVVVPLLILLFVAVAVKSDVVLKVHQESLCILLLNNKFGKE